MKAILERRSIRKYTDEPISDQDIKELLQAAMAAPSAGNQQPWEFIVVNDREILNKIPEVHPYSQMLMMAPLAIIVCGNLDKEKHEGYWVQDCSAATENILIEAQYKGLGAVWLGIYPRKERVKGLKELFNLPEDIIPLSIVSIGHPAESKEPSNRYNQSAIHINKW
jgi:nitroreductase